jgi:hypothetical protein
MTVGRKAHESLEPWRQLLVAVGRTVRRHLPRATNLRANEASGGSISLPAGWYTPTLAAPGDAEDLPDGWRLVLL